MTFGWFEFLSSVKLCLTLGSYPARAVVPSLLAALWGWFPCAATHSDFLGREASLVPWELSWFTSLIEIGLTGHVCTLWWPGDTGDLRHKAKGPDGRGISEAVEQILQSWHVQSVAPYVRCKVQWGLLAVPCVKDHERREENPQICTSGRWEPTLKLKPGSAMWDCSPPALPFSFCASHCSSLSNNNHISVVAIIGWVKACVRARRLERWICLFRRELV